MFWYSFRFHEFPKKQMYYKNKLNITMYILMTTKYTNIYMQIFFNNSEAWFPCPKMILRIQNKTFFCVINKTRILHMRCSWKQMATESAHDEDQGIFMYLVVICAKLSRLGFDLFLIKTKKYDNTFLTTSSYRNIPSKRNSRAKEETIYMTLYLVTWMMLQNSFNKCTNAVFEKYSSYLFSSL